MWSADRLPVKPLSLGVRRFIPSANPRAVLLRVRGKLRTFCLVAPPSLAQKRGATLVSYINRCFFVFLDKSMSYSLRGLSPSSVNVFLFPLEHTVCSVQTVTIPDASSSPGRSKAPSNHAPSVCWNPPPRQAGSAPGTDVQVGHRT